MRHIGVIGTIVFMFGTSGCGIGAAKSYGSLEPVAGKATSKGRDWCGGQAKEFGGRSTWYSEAGWASAIGATGLATSALVFPNDQGSTWKENRATVLLAGSAAVGALAYAFFDRSNVHSQAAASMESAVGNADDEKAYSLCLGAISTVYSSRVDTNKIAIDKMLDKNTKEVERRAATVNAESTVAAANTAVATAESKLAKAKDAVTVADKAVTDAKPGAADAKKKADSDLVAAENQLAVAKAVSELAQAELDLAQVQSDASEDAKTTAKQLVSELRKKLAAARAKAAEVTLPAPPQ